mmetsp:Transcript_17008/g.68592  ORF Transcript_17008/g.68592 Transcript_17008/m.68592 type:complete len:252 (-) Transcript_17008:218-973(-)
MLGPRLARRVQLVPRVVLGSGQPHRAARPLDLRQRLDRRRHPRQAVRRVRDGRGRHLRVGQRDRSVLVAQLPERDPRRRRRGRARPAALLGLDHLAPLRLQGQRRRAGRRPVRLRARLRPARVCLHRHLGQPPGRPESQGRRRLLAPPETRLRPRHGALSRRERSAERGRRLLFEEAQRRGRHRVLQGTRHEKVGAHATKPRSSPPPRVCGIESRSRSSGLLLPGFRSPCVFLLIGQLRTALFRASTHDRL